jgi:hypothetical protein
MCSTGGSWRCWPDDDGGRRPAGDRARLIRRAGCVPPAMVDAEQLSLAAVARAILVAWLTTLLKYGPSIRRSRRSTKWLPPCRHFTDAPPSKKDPLLPSSCCIRPASVSARDCEQSKRTLYTALTTFHCAKADLRGSTARTTGYGGTDILRADSAYHSAAFSSAVRQAGAWFSVTMNTDPRSPPPSSGGTSTARYATTWHDLELLLCCRIAR